MTIYEPSKKYKINYWNSLYRTLISNLTFHDDYLIKILHYYLTLLQKPKCKGKWHHLRSNFMREKREINVIPSGSANTKTRRWVYYDAMQFVIPHVTPRPASSNVPTPPNESICHETEDALKYQTTYLLKKQQVILRFVTAVLSNLFFSFQRSLVSPRNTAGTLQMRWLCVS